MTDGVDHPHPVDRLGNEIDTALDEVLQAAQARLMNASGDMTRALGRFPDDNMLSGLHGVEWQLLHVANLATVANLARRRALAHPEKLDEIIGEATLLANWFREQAAHPPQFMGSHLIPRIGMHDDPDAVWANMINTMMARRLREDDGQQLGPRETP